tara:strand:- start:93 stop:545 length:453 start_codon:yes stop_codon:yes gene_type:complete
MNKDVWLFICTGNTCRSPMAEVIAREVFFEVGIDTIEVRSAGIHAFEGSPVSVEANQALRTNGWEFTGKSVLLDYSMASKSKRILCMTQFHKAAVREILDKKGHDTSHVVCLNEDHDVSDPIGCGQPVYEKLLKELESLIRIEINNFMEN